MFGGPPGAMPDARPPTCKDAPMRESHQPLDIRDPGVLAAIGRMDGATAKALEQAA